MGNQVLSNDDQQSNQRIINDESGITSDEQHDAPVRRSLTVNDAHRNDDIHIISLDDLYKRFHTDPRQGLSASSVVDARARYGENKFTQPKSASFLSLLFKELFIGFNIILWVAGVFAFLAYKPLGEPHPSIANLALGVILAVVIVSNSLLNVYQQLKSMKIISSFSTLLPTLVTVRRDGRMIPIVVDQIVPGDIICIRAGDKLPADCRFLICEGLTVSISLRHDARSVISCKCRRSTQPKSPAHQSPLLQPFSVQVTTSWSPQISDFIHPSSKTVLARQSSLPLVTIPSLAAGCETKVAIQATASLVYIVKSTVSSFSYLSPLLFRLLCYGSHGERGSTGIIMFFSHTMAILSIRLV